MQFKHPEILWGLLVLLIPILVHLLQLRRFRKTAFTNVAMLQRVVSESRKSQNLKKWLLLLTRLLLLAALIIAFAQPFSSNSGALTERETVIYLDNSFSTQAKRDGVSLLRNWAQELIQEIPDSQVFSIFTNERTYRNVTIKEIQNELLALSHSVSQLSLDQIQLKASSLLSEKTNTIKDVILVSDLQERKPLTLTSDSTIQFRLVQNLPNTEKNIYIDSLYLGEIDGDQLSLNIKVIGLEHDEAVPISLYNDNRLIAKTAVKGVENESVNTVLTLEKDELIKGKVIIEDSALKFDNRFFFNIDKRQKPKVLAISEEDDTPLKRVFFERDFEFLGFDLNTLNYSLLESQNSVILNGLQTIPNSLSSVLLDFYANGGTLIIVPALENLDIETYNTFLKELLPMRFSSSLSVEQRISKISFQHPLYRNVFEKEVTNFDYPTVNSFYQSSTNGAVALSFENGSPFLVSQDNCFVFTASLSQENSSFINSPLVVPTLYNMGEMSLKNPSLYQTIGNSQTVDIANKMAQDKILRLKGLEAEFIPLQKSFSNKVQLQFDGNPSEDGIYSVINGTDTIQNLSFNYPRNESNLEYLNVNELKGIENYESVSRLFKKLQDEVSVIDYWKWFVIFVLFFAVLELLIQKFLP